MPDVVVIRGDRPAYRILAEAGFFGPDCHLYKRGDAIYFDDEPNEEMEPLNELAQKAHRAYFEKLDQGAAEAAAKNGRVFVGRARTLDEKVAFATADAKRISLVEGDGGVPLMKGKPTNAGAIAAVGADEEIPDTGGARVNKRGPQLSVGPRQ